MELTIEQKIQQIQEYLFNKHELYANFEKADSGTITNRYASGFLSIAIPPKQSLLFESAEVNFLLYMREKDVTRIGACYFLKTDGKSEDCEEYTIMYNFYHKSNTLTKI